MAVAVVELFRILVTSEKWNTAKYVSTLFLLYFYFSLHSDYYLFALLHNRDLIYLIKTCGKILVAELPLQTSAENMIRRMLKIVRDEYMTARLIKENEERNLKENEVSSPITPSNWNYTLGSEFGHISVH